MMGSEEWWNCWSIEGIYSHQPILDYNYSKRKRFQCSDQKYIKHNLGGFRLYNLIAHRWDHGMSHSRVPCI